MATDIRLLDCTLRDGGYINEWNWGENRTKRIISKLSKSGVDIIEVGFLRNESHTNPDVTVSSSISDLNRYIEVDSNAVFSAMAMISNYNIDQLAQYEGIGIELIRVTAHDYDISELYGYASKIQDKGYKVSINPINIMGYSDYEILEVIKHVNDFRPFQFTIVDTFGSMNRGRLRQIVDLIDNNLDNNIRLGLHLHENMALSYSLAQDFLGMNLDRAVTIDGSLMGMGRTPGNLPIELICDYVNTYCNKSYNLDYILDAIYDYIYPFRGEIKWGYTPEYFLSAKYNLHRNYAEYLLKKGDLTTKDINFILARIDRTKATVFDKEYADFLYDEYNTNRIDDSTDREKLGECIANREVMIVSPGGSLNSYLEYIQKYIECNNPITIALNFEPDIVKCNYVFYTNHKRFSNSTNKCAQIVTSNIKLKKDAEFYLDYNSLSGAFKQGCNSLIMLLKLLKGYNPSRISIVGADGYKNENDYYESSLRSYVEHDKDFNIEVSKAIKYLGVNVSFLTPTEYGESVWK